MKKIFTLLKPALLIVVAGMFITCNKISSGDYRNLVPDNSFMTISINPGSLLDKAGFSQAERAAYRSQAEMMLGFVGGAISAEDQQLLLSIIDSPDNSGVSFKDDMYVFVQMDNPRMANDPHAGFVAKVNNRKKIDQIVDMITKLSPEFSVKNEGGLSLITVDESRGNTVLIAYDDNALMLYRTTYDYATTFSEISAAFKGNGMASDNLYAPFFASKSDIGMLMSYEAIMKFAEDQMQAIPYANLLSSMNIYMNTDFKKGVIETDFGIIFKDNESKKEFEKINSYKKLSGKYADIIPNNALAAMSGSLDGEAIYTSISQIPQYAFLAMVPEVKNILSAFNGDLVFAFTGMDIPNQDFRGFFAATVKDATILDTLLEQVGSMIDINPTGANSYSTNVGPFEVAFGVHENTLYFANDPVMIEALKGKSVDKLDNKIHKHFKNGYGAFYININRIVGIVSEMVNNNPFYVGNDTAQVLHFMNAFEDLVIYASEPMEGKMLINMVDKSENAAATIANFIKDIAMQNGGF